MSEKILIDNARESWSQACIHCNLILDGYVTLQYRKMFVAMLHNSVELLIKQRMLDINDFRVARVNKIDSTGAPATAYYQATDLNDYFKGNGTKDDRGKSIFYSIEFNEFHKIHKEIFNAFYDENSGFSSEISGGLTLLAELRNDETHFYVNAIDFLNGSQFKQLQKFMIAFAKVLDYYGLLPTYSPNTTSKIQPNPSIPEKSDYKSFLKNNKDIKAIAQYLNGKRCKKSTDPFEIIDYLYFNTNFDRNSIYCSYEDAISLMTGVVQYGLVKTKEHKIESEDENGNVKVSLEHIFEFNV